MVPSLPPRRIPQTDEAAAELKKRTLTKLYNQRPAWLTHLHEDLDSAVLAAYGWTDQPDKDALLARLLALNLARA